MQIPILDLGLSQIYLDQAKVNAVQKWFRPEQINFYEPLPVHDFGNGRLTLTDGHSRAYVAWLYNIHSLPVIYDNDEIVTDKTGTKLYQNCIHWCDRFSLYKIADLENRILPPEAFQELWVKRCSLNYNLVTKCSEKLKSDMERRYPCLHLYGADESLKSFFFEDNDGKRFRFPAPGTVADCWTCP